MLSNNSSAEDSISKNRAQRTRFTFMEIELRGLALCLWKSSSKHSISVQPTLPRIFFLVLPFHFFSKCRPTLHTYSPEAFAAWVWSDRRLGCWVFALSRQRDTSDLYVLHRLKLSPPGFGQNRRLGFIVASFFFVLNSLGCWVYLTVSALLNRVHWARFP